MDDSNTLGYLSEIYEYCPEFIQYDIWKDGSGYKNYVLDKLKEDRISIVLSHANHPEWGNANQLKDTIPELRKMDYEFLTVSEALNKYAPK